MACGFIAVKVTGQPETVSIKEYLHRWTCRAHCLTAYGTHGFLQMRLIEASLADNLPMHRKLQEFEIVQTKYASRYSGR